MCSLGASCKSGHGLFEPAFHPSASWSSTEGLPSLTERAIGLVFDYPVRLNQDLLLFLHLFLKGPDHQPPIPQIVPCQPTDTMLPLGLSLPGKV